jgi:hypothetical protein
MYNKWRHIRWLPRGISIAAGSRVASQAITNAADKCLLLIMIVLKDFVQIRSDLSMTAKSWPT